jgi:hypothetical protein
MVNNKQNSGVGGFVKDLVNKGGLRVNADSMKGLTRSGGGDAAAGMLGQILVESQGEERDLGASAKRVAAAGGKAGARKLAIEGVAQGVEKAAAKTIFKEAAKAAAKETVKQTGKEAAKQAAKTALRGNLATGLATMAVDQAVDTYRLARGGIDRREYISRSGKNAGSAAGGLGGAAAGAALGTLIFPGPGTVILGFVGGMAGSVGSSWAAGRIFRWNK